MYVVSICVTLRPPRRGTSTNLLVTTGSFVYEGNIIALTSEPEVGELKHSLDVATLQVSAVV